jgi:predicted HD phosphohydrolase
MDATQASPVSARMAVSREQKGHPLVPLPERAGRRVLCATRESHQTRPVDMVGDVTTTRSKEFCMTDVVSFTRMQDGTAEDYALLDRIETEELKSFPDRVLGWLLTMKDTAGYQISRLDHSLQAATRAHRAGEDEETVVCALLHDIGDYLAPANHSEVAAAMLRPYVSEKNYWIVKHHGVFQGYYYFHHAGMDRNVRDRWCDHEHYQATVDFCANYDENSFDPDYDSEPLSFFEPMVRRVLDESRRHDL